MKLTDQSCSFVPIRRNAFRMVKTLFIFFVFVLGTASIIGTGGGGGGGGDDENVDNSNFYGTYEVTLSVDDCDPDEFGLTIGNDQSLIESDGYIYIPQTESSYSPDGGTITVSGNTISIDVIEDDGTIDINFVFNEDYSSFTISGTMTSDDPEECSGAAVGSATRWVFNKVSFPVTVRAEIDGVSQLKIKGSIMWWHHIDWEPPEEISLNDENWYLMWPGDELTDCDCDSSSLNALESPLREEPTMISIDIVTARGEVEIVQQPDVGNDYTAVIEFDDHVGGIFPGSEMYEIIINYNGGSQSLTITGKSGNQVSLDGTWEGSCYPDDEDVESDKQYRRISGSTFTNDSYLWLSSLTCAGASDATFTDAGTFGLGDEVTVLMDSSNVTATRLDIVRSLATAEVHNQATADLFNMEQECGFNDWVIGVPKNILGTDCEDSDNKNVVYIDDTLTPDLMILGDHDSPDSNGYPTELDIDIEYSRW